MNFRCSISLLLFLVFFARQSTAQEMSVIRYDERNGLTADVIYGIAQDKYGFLWLGTENGVFRFDGATFKKFSVEDGLTDNVTLGVHTSRNDHIFFEPFSGNPCYYRNGRFLNSESDTALRSLRMKGVNQYHYLEQENRLLFLQAGQNQYWHVGFNAGKLYTQHVQLPGPNRLITATPLKHHFLILSYYNDSLLCHFVEQDKPVHTTAFAKVTDKSTRAVALYHKGILYIGIGNTLYNCLWQPGKPIQVLRTTTYPRILKNFFPGSKGLYITFYQAGVYFFEEGNTPETLLPEAVVNHVFEDKDGNTWMGTDGKGLFMLKRKQVLNRSVEPNTTTERAVILLNDKNGSVFCGYDNMTVTRFQNGQAKQFIVSESGRPEAGFVTAMQFRKHNELMLGTSKGLVLLNLVTGRTRNLKINGNRFSYIKCLYVESDSISYAGTSSHLLRVLIGKGEQLSITDTLMPERTISVHPRNNSQLWAGTLTGLYSVAQHGHGQVEYANGPLRTAKINSMATRNGFSYFATDRGLIISGKTFSRVVNKAQGLSDENCKRINLFGNAIFTATSTGVFRIQLLNDSTAGNITQYNQWDGLASDNVNDLLVYNDTVWAATNKGLNIFVPASIPAAPRPGVALLGLNTGAGNYAVHEPQVLPAGENNVTVSYAGISFYNRNGLYFEYRLLNRFTQWTRTANTSVTFNGLKPGTYTFEIRAFNANGTPGAVTERLQFSIKPFFWQTTAFRILLAAVIIALVFWLLRLREQRIKRKQRLRVEYENKVSELELEAIKAQINPHFIYNCLNAIQNSILKNNMEESHRQLSLFSKLVRKTLDLSRLNFINLAEEIAYLDMYLQLEKMRFREQLQYSIQAVPGIVLQETEIPVMLLQPFVENAVKHGLKTNEGAVSEIKVRFSQDKGLLECSIEDSGAGMPPGTGNNTHRSLGMHISSGRADTYNKLFGSNISIRHLNKPGNGLTGTGTIVIVQIPLK